MAESRDEIYEVLSPINDPRVLAAFCEKGRTSSATPPSGYTTYDVPRGLDGTPARKWVIPPAVPPRNPNMQIKYNSDDRGKSSSKSRATAG